MSNVNEPTNPVIDIAETAAKKLIMDVLVKKAIELAIKEAAWLTLPIINPLFVFIMNFAGKYLYKVITLEAAFIIIGKQVEHQRDRYEEAMTGLQTAIKEGKSNEEIERERLEAEKRLRDLINFNM